MQRKFATRFSVLALMPALILAGPVSGSAAVPADDPSTSQARVRLDANIQAMEATVGKQQRDLSVANDKVLAARAVLALARAAYQKSDPGTADELFAEIAVAVAERILDEMNAKKSRVESNLRASRERLNRLRSEREALGN